MSDVVLSTGRTVNEPLSGIVSSESAGATRASPGSRLDSFVQDEPFQSEGGREEPGVNNVLSAIDVRR